MHIFLFLLFGIPLVHLAVMHTQSRFFVAKAIQRGFVWLSKFECGQP